jgi:hypothetical protein
MRLLEARLSLARSTKLTTTRLAQAKWWLPWRILRDALVIVLALALTVPSLDTSLGSARLSASIASTTPTEIPPVSPASSSFQDVTTSSISCPSSSTCFAIGTYLNSSSQTEGFIATYNGSTWSNPTTITLPSDATGFVALSGLACPDATSEAGCWILGWYQEDATTSGLVVADASSGFATLGTTATTLSAPTDGTLQAGSLSLNGISCPSSSTCFAVGQNGLTFFLNGATTDPVTSAPVVVEDSSGTWSTPTSLPLPSNASNSGFATLDAISCSSTTSCVAVGTYDDSSGATQGLIETYSGTSWTPTELSLPADAYANPEVALDAISCSSTTSCVAVGSYDGSTPMVVQWSGSTIWSAQPLALPLDASASEPSPQLTGVSCPSTTTCWVVGDYLVSGTHQEEAINYVDNGGTWSPPFQLSPSASVGATSTALNAIACVDESSCYAVGDLTEPNGAIVPASALETSGSWSNIEPLATPNTQVSAYAYGVLNSVACSGSIAECEGVGVFNDSAGYQVPMVSSLGTSATASEIALPSDARPSHAAGLSAIACGSTSSGGCVAVGSTPVLTNQIVGLGLDVAVSPVTSPTAPLDVQAVAGDGLAEVSWQPPVSNGGSPVTSYEVFEGTSGSSIATNSSYVCVTSALECPVTGLSNGTTYYFEVVAFNEAGGSQPSNPASKKRKILE